MSKQTLTEKDSDEGDEELVVVETPPVEAAPTEKDERVVKNNDDDESDADDKPDADPDRELIRQRRRAERANQKEQRKRNKIELDFLREQNERLERRLAGVEEHTRTRAMSDIDARIQSAVREAQVAEQVIAKAVAAGNGDDVTQAMRYRDKAVNDARQLHALKQEAEARQQQPSTPQVDQRVASLANEFISENKWYDPQGRNEESAIMLAIDQGLIRDGYDPKTEEYWDELRVRGARRLPDKFTFAKAAQAHEDTRKPRGGPSVGSGREHAPASTRQEIYISPERKQALIDAGAWDDPVLRAKYVKRYSEYDKAARNKQ